MEEIGCHFKFENIDGNNYHDTNLLLSSGRNCLRYIIKERNINTIFLPYFLCESLTDVSLLENTNIKYYHIDKDYLPIDLDKMRLNDESYLYLVNYYGMLKDDIKKIVDDYKYVIVDNTHDFFDKDYYNTDVIYNYRKYFGVPDGACIVSDNLKYNHNYQKGKSLNKIIEMVSRDETGEFFHYPSFIEADKYFKNEDLRYMSNFTENYIHSINYEDVLNKRLNNYKMLRVLLSKYNEMDLSNKELTYMFPLRVNKDGEQLRSYLGENNIYSLKLWPNVELPIDQRYSNDEMEYMFNVINNYYCKKLIK